MAATHSSSDEQGEAVGGRNCLGTSAHKRLSSRAKGRFDRATSGRPGAHKDAGPFLWCALREVSGALYCDFSCALVDAGNPKRAAPT